MRVEKTVGNGRLRAPGSIGVRRRVHRGQAEKGTRQPCVQDGSKRLSRSPLYRMFEVRFGGFDPKVESQAKLRRSILAKVVHSERDGLVLLPADVIAGLGDVLESIAGC